MRQRVEQDFNQDLKQLGVQNFYPPRGSREKYKHVKCISSVVSGNLFEDVQIYLKLILNPAIHVNFLKKKVHIHGTPRHTPGYKPERQNIDIW